MRLRALPAPLAQARPHQDLVLPPVLEAVGRDRAVEGWGGGVVWELSRLAALCKAAAVQQPGACLH